MTKRLRWAQKWLRQQSKDFYDAGFEALVNWWDKCINVGGEYVVKFFSGFEYHMFYMVYPFVTYLLAEVAETTVKRLLWCGFRSTGKVMEQVYQCWWVIRREMFFQVWISHGLHVISICDLFIGSPLYCLVL
jgi:hypothetical protein